MECVRVCFLMMLYVEEDGKVYMMGKDDVAQVVVDT